MAELSGGDVAALREGLRLAGSAVLTDPRGRRLFLVHSRTLGLDEPALLAAWDGVGAALVPAGRPTNRMRLVAAGFDLGTAAELAALLNAVLGFVSEGEGLPALTDGPA